MTQNFNFKVNIERLNPHTGQLLYVDRMTSDYALAHPFDVDGYLEQVYQKWAECETVQFRETREALRKMWNAVLGDMNPGGNAALYPNAHSPHPALMEVWHKAGDYWRRGLRINDALPENVPLFKIVRLEDGSWISISDKDKHLLEQTCEIREEVKVVEEFIHPTPDPSLDKGGEYVCPTPTIEPITEQPSGKVEQTKPIAEQPKPKRKERKAKKAHSSTPSPRQLDLFGVPVADSVIDDAQDQSDHKVLKAVGITLAGVAVMAILIHTGMLIPMGLLGLAAGGMMK